MALAGSPLGAIAVMGIECSTFVSINKGTSKRDELNPMGDTDVDSVEEANMATSRQAGAVMSVCWFGDTQTLFFLKCSVLKLEYAGPC